MTETLSRANLRSRYRFAGRLVMDTALHIGGGREASAITDSPVVREATGQPFVPGSSLKGAFRAAVERLVPLLGLRTCQLADDCDDCLSTNRKLSKHYQVMRRQLGDKLRGDKETRQAIRELQHAIEELGQGSPELDALSWPHWVGQTISENHLLAPLHVLPCETCKTFGSVHLASVAFFHDLPVDGTWYDMVQVRDGVGIDRDSERSREEVKYDFEVVPPQTAFRFGLALENPRDRDLGLIALGLQEFTQGMVPLGGIRSRGFGRCRLTDLKVASVDLTSEAARRDYLITGQMSEEDGESFIARHLGTLMAA
ncbi:MAG: RAMP superfamily CRISPR-associated protein [Gammaproteobacteria bacterium]